METIHNPRGNQKFSMSEDPDIEKLTRWGQARETGKEDAHHLKGANIRKLGCQSNREDMNAEEIDTMIRPCNS